MALNFLVPLLAFGTLFAVIWFAVFGVRGAKRAQASGEVSALSRETTGRPLTRGEPTR